MSKFPPAEAQPPRWMHALYRDRRNISLAEILIPGSHNAGSHRIHPTSGLANQYQNCFYRLGKPLVAAWGRTQEHDIRRQLLGGIRYLDLRVERHDGQFVLVHGLIGETLTRALADVRTFLADNPFEFVILDVCNDRVNDRDGLSAQIKASLAELLIGREHAPTTTLHELWAAGPGRVYVAMSEAASVSNDRCLWYRDELLVSEWADTTDMARLEQFVKQRIVDRDVDRFHVAQLVLTPNIRTIAAGLLCRGRRPDSNARLNRPLESMATSWLADWHAAGLRTNIVMVDYYNRTGIVDAIIAMNTDSLR